MGKYWDWYEVEFDRVGKRLNRERRAEIMDSLREHVSDASAEFRAQKISDDEAERMAIKNLGTPLDLVRAELSTSKWQSLPVWIAGAGLAWCAAWMLIGSLTWTMNMILPVLWLTPIAVLLATFWGRKVKLWAFGGTIAAIGAVTLAVLSFTWLDLKAAGGMGYVPRWDVNAAVMEEKARASTERAKANDFNQTHLAFKADDQSLAKKLSYFHGQGWRVPTGYWAGPSQYESKYVPSYEEAKRAWVTRKAQVWNGMQEDIARLESSYAAMLDPRSLNPRGVFSEHLAPFIRVAFSIFGILATCHLLALFLIWLPGAAARRRWRLAI